MEPEHMQIWNDVHIATMSETGAPYGLIEDGAIVVVGDKIAWIGSAGDLPEEYDGANTTSCGGQFMTPGLVDCHTHLVYGGNRVAEFEQRLQGVSYEEIARSGGG